MIEGDNDGPWTVRTLKEYFERILKDFDRRITCSCQEIQKAKEFNRGYYSREQHDSYANAIQKQLDAMDERTESLRRPQWQLWFSAIALLLTIISGLWYLSIQPLREELSHLSEKDKSLSEQSKITNDRIDRLYELYRDLQQQHAEALRRMNGMQDAKKPPR